MLKNKEKIKYLTNFLSIFVFIVFIIYELNINFDFLIKEINIIESYQNANVLLYEMIKNVNISTESIIKSKNIETDNIYKTVDDTYFNNTLFIGDSRTVGFKVYKTLSGTAYYASKTFGVYGGFDRTMELDYFGVVTLEELLNKNQFSKIYIWLGINNAPTDPKTHEQKFRNFVYKIQEMQPNAIIYLLANLHVTKYYDQDPRVNNEKINIINNFIKNIADNKKIFFLDPNFIYDNEDGALDYLYSADDMHIRVMYYDKFLDFLKEHAIDIEKLEK